MTNQSMSQELARKLPLLKAIGREARDRQLSIRDLETRLAALTSTAHAHAEEIQRIESDLSLHRRELRGVEKELGRLGCAFDEDQPGCIVVAETSEAVEILRLDDTQFYYRTATSA